MSSPVIAPPLAGKTIGSTDDAFVIAEWGSAVFVPRGTPHTYWNPGPGPVRYLLVMTTNIFRLIQDIHAMSERTPAAMQAVFKKYNSELL